MSTIQRLADMVEPLRAGFAERFPGGFVTVRHSTNIKDSVLICFSPIPREKWPNNIFENCGTKILIMEKTHQQREGDSGLYEAEQGSLGDRQRIPKMRRRTASAEKIVAYILKWVDSVPR